MLLTLVTRATRFRRHDGVVDVALRYSGLLRDGGDGLLARQPGRLAHLHLPHQLLSRQLDVCLGSSRHNDGDLTAYPVGRPGSQLTERSASYLLMGLRQLTADNCGAPGAER